MATDFQIHQALFGYDGGHHLLQSSVTLPPEASQSLAVATDLSGSATSKGFDLAITGMPVSGTDFYALFCTWLAPEMRRPGCVWSHVLLIEVADLPRIENLGCLRKFFLRPESGKKDIYGTTIRCAPSDLVSEMGSLTSCGEMELQCLAALYGEPQRSVVISSNDSLEYEDFVFAVWSQQWPRLRRGFRFSTGSFADRGRIGVPFDFQITPDKNRRSWLGSDEHLVVDYSMLGSTENGRWVGVAIQDLAQPNREGFRSFLRANGSDLNAPRAAFAKLARTFLVIKEASAPKWPSILTAIAKEFPSPEDAIALKRSCILPQLNESIDNSIERLWWALHRIFHEAPGESFGGITLDFTYAVATLWPKKRNEISQLLAIPPHATSEHRWSELAGAVAEIVSGSDLLWLWERMPELMPTLVRLKPHLAANIQVWRLPERAQWRLIEALESCPVAAETWRNIVGAMLEADTSVGVKEVIEVAGHEAFDGSLCWTERQGDKLPPASWRQPLSVFARARLQKGELSPLELAFCIALLPPYVLEKIAAARKDVQDLCSMPLENLPVVLRLPTAFFLVTVGLKGSGAAGAASLSHGFFAVHAALATETEPPESWRLLQRQLPPFRWWEWDRCGKLRDSVREWMHSNGGQKVISNAARSTSDRELAHSLVK